MNTRTLERFRRRLHLRRREIVENQGASERGVQSIRESRNDPEFEEGAQADDVEYSLEQLSEGQLREIAQIDAALARIDADRYGLCIECHEPIPLDRLDAVPYALRDEECAARAEEQAPPHAMPTM